MDPEIHPAGGRANGINGVSELFISIDKRNLFRNATETCRVLIIVGISNICNVWERNQFVKVIVRE